MKVSYKEPHHPKSDWPGSHCAFQMVWGGGGRQRDRGSLSSTCPPETAMLKKCCVPIIPGLSDVRNDLSPYPDLSSVDPTRLHSALLPARCRPRIRAGTRPMGTEPPHSLSSRERNGHRLHMHTQGHMDTQTAHISAHMGLLPSSTWPCGPRSDSSLLYTIPWPQESSLGCLAEPVRSQFQDLQ